MDSVRSSAAAGSGHPTSSMSAADLMAVLLDGHLRLDYSNPANPANDHLIFSKGHASPLYYAVLKAVGAIDDDELLTFRKLGSRLEGHPTPRIPPTDVATGSLGQGLPIGVGVAMAGRSLDKLPYRVWVLCGDSEMAEGSMWEAFQHAGWEGLSNLTAIIDVNRLGQTRETMLGWDLDGYVRRIEAFGWKAIAIDGHDVDAIEAAYAEAEATTDRPTAIVAQTKKGKGVKAVEDQDGKHGKPLDDPEAAIAELGGERDLVVDVAKPEAGSAARVQPSPAARCPSYELGDEVATRKAYGESIAALADIRGDVVALDGEVSNSTHSEDFRKAHPDRYFEMFIAEQQLVAAAVGMQVRGWTPYVSTFAAFLSRAYDFVRMGAISRAKLVLSGSHAGVSIGEDGPSQMALEDMASLRAIHGSTVAAPERRQPDRGARRGRRRPAGHHVHPHAARQDPGAHARGRGADRRLARSPTRATTSRSSPAASALDEAVKAAERLAGDGVHARVLDAYSIKPIDAEAVRAAARDCGAIVTVEDHAPEGGLGDAVLDALAEGDERAHVVKLAVREIPGSGTPEELLHGARIDADAIADAASKLVAAPA